MTDPSSGTSFAAKHPQAERITLKVAQTATTAFNTIRMPLVPVACWRLNAPAFGFDSSFMMPSFREELAGLADIVAAHPGCLAAIFAHCDPVGDDALNKVLSDRRAMAVYALLTRQPELWEDLYANPAVGDSWGATAIQWMLASVEDGDGNGYYAEGIDGDYGPKTTDAVKRFQQDNGLSVDGQAGPLTRNVLFGKYMDWLTTPPTDPTPSSASSTATPFRMQVTDFLGGAAATAGDALPAMSLQGCGEFNPIVLLPVSELSGKDQTTRNADNAPNRRVLMFLFPAGSKPDPSAWPCPKVKESGAACAAALWPNGSERRRSGSELRLYQESRDTMACRFYDRFARRSPCEASQGELFLVRLHDDSVRPIVGQVPYRATLDQRSPIASVSPDGWARIRIPKGERPRRLHLEWGKAAERGAPYPFGQDIVIEWSQGTDKEQVVARLNNIAYRIENDGELDQAVVQFQSDYGIAEQGLLADGTLPTATGTKLNQIYSDPCDATREEDA